MLKKHQLHKQLSFKDYKELIEWAPEAHKGKNAYSYRANLKDNTVTRISFSEFRDDVRGMASKLIDMGCKDKHCVVIGKLSYEWAVLYFSILASDGVIVPLDRDWHAEELAKTAKTLTIEELPSVIVKVDNEVSANLGLATKKPLDITLRGVEKDININKIST